MTDNILEVHHLKKYYDAVKALDDVSISFHRGEVHALAGENGAGKSTLIKSITGAIEPSAGTIVLEGKEHSKFTPIEAIEYGIAAIYQEFTLIPHLTVAENIYFGKEIVKNGFVDKKAMNAKVAKLLDEMGIDLDPASFVRDLGIAYQQIVEIVKAVAANSKILIMDEPTAPLTNNETEMLFRIIDKLKERNVTILYISHRIEEIFRVCDRVSVMRDGKYICTENTSDISIHQLIAHMVGRELGEDYPVRKVALGDVVLKVDQLHSQKVHGVSFELRRGEILGFGGLVGAGRTEVMQALYGADPVKSGTVTINGKVERITSPTKALEKGIGLIPEDRKNQGVLLGLTVRENITFSSLAQAMVGPFVKSKKDMEIAEEYTEKLQIKTPSVNQLVKNLSGGNQQKVVLAKVLATKCDIIIFDEPTRGIDVGAKQEIYNLMRTLVDEEGKSIIMVSSEMPELIGMSDRILVMRHGRIAGEIGKADFSQELILEYASGLIGG
ncbi:MAG: sugar ABC transporter ATP-binding protein [Clostridiales bacterium]|nr:sugar ABC transporter ATP-binding protein [Bacillota bacterium]NLL54931.1 sugar ABC transporter ATP-binding protein [Clostridiales bacterium]